MAYSEQLSQATNQLMSFGGWFCLGWAVNWLQSIYYSLTIRAGSRKPAPGSPQWLKHRRTIHISVIVIYLLYTIYEADWRLQRDGDFHQFLGIPIDADERAIQSKFRRLASQYHPDKLSLPNPAAYAAASTYFVRLQLARDTLVSSAKRFAYDRFGPDIVMQPWHQCITVRDFVYHAFMHSFLPFYISTGVFMAVLNMLGYLNWGRYWRWVAFLAMAAFEARIISSPTPLLFVTKVVNPVFGLFGHPPYLPFQTIVVARKILVAVFIALQQIAPLLKAPMQQTQASEAQRLQMALDRLDLLARGACVEAGRLLEMELRPFVGDERAVKDLHGKMMERVVKNALEADPEVREAVEKVRMRANGDIIDDERRDSAEAG